MATGRIGTTPVLTTRWSKAPSAGTTSLSGLDDNSVSLVYSVGYEAVYQNGVLLSRGNDYTATNGTTITLTTATVAGDIIEVFANQTIPLTDTYSQTVSDGRFIKNTLTTTTGDIIYASAANTPARLAIGSTDQVLKVSGGIPAWGTLSSAMTQLADTTLGSAAADITFSSISSSYNHLMVIISGRCSHTGTNGTDLQVRLNSDTGNNYSSARNTTYATSGGTVTILGNNGSSSMLLSNLWVGKVSSDYVANVTLYFPDYKNTTLNKTMNFSGGSYSDAPAVGTGFARWTNTSAITTIRLFSGAGNFDTGTRATLYGLV